MSDGRPGPLPASMLGYARWLVYALGVLVLLFSELMSVSTVLWVSALVAGLVTLAQLLSGPGTAAAGDLTDTATPVEGSSVSSGIASSAAWPKDTAPSAMAASYAA